MLRRCFLPVLLLIACSTGTAVADEPVPDDRNLALQVQEFFEQYGPPSDSGGMKLELADGDRITPEMVRLLAQHITEFYRALAELPRPEAESSAAASIEASPVEADPEKMRAFTRKILDFHTQSYLDDPVLREMAPREGEQVLCYYCDYGLNVCLNVVLGIIEDCQADMGDPIFCSNLLLDLTATCYARYINCLPACTF